MAISSHVDKEPIRRLGTTLPEGWAYGSGTIAGTLIAKQLTHGALWKVRRHMATIRYAGGEALASTAAPGVLEPGYFTPEMLQQAERGELDIQRVRSEVDNYASAMLVQQLPPFHLMFVHQNESGQMGLERLYGVTFTDHAVTKGTNNQTAEESLQFKAVYIEHLRLRRSLTTSEMQRLFSKSLEGQDHKGVGFFNDIRKPQMVDELDEALGSKNLSDYLLDETRESIRRTERGEATSFNIMNSGAVIIQPFQTGEVPEDPIELEPDYTDDPWKPPMDIGEGIDEPYEPEPIEEEAEDLEEPYSSSEVHTFRIHGLGSVKHSAAPIVAEANITFRHQPAAATDKERVVVQSGDYALTVGTDVIESGDITASNTIGEDVTTLVWENYKVRIFEELVYLIQQWWSTISTDVFDPRIWVQYTNELAIEAYVKLGEFEENTSPVWLPEGTYVEASNFAEGEVRISQTVASGPDSVYEYDLTDIRKPWPMPTPPNTVSAQQLMGAEASPMGVSHNQGITTVGSTSVASSHVRFRPDRKPDALYGRITYGDKSKEWVFPDAVTSNLIDIELQSEAVDTSQPLSYYTEESDRIAEVTVVPPGEDNASGVSNIVQDDTGSPVLPYHITAILTHDGHLKVRVFHPNGVLVYTNEDPVIGTPFTEYALDEDGGGTLNLSPHLTQRRRIALNRRTRTIQVDELNIEVEVEAWLAFALYDIRIARITVRPQAKTQVVFERQEATSLEPAYREGDMWYTKSGSLPTDIVHTIGDMPELSIDADYVVTYNNLYLGHMTSDGLPYTVNHEVTKDEAFWDSLSQ